MKSYIEKKYHLAPVWIQNLIISFYGLILYTKRYGKTYHSHYKTFINKDYSNYDLEKQNQEKKFIEFVKKTNMNSLFYKNFYKNIDISEFTSLDDIQKLPIVDKELLRKNINDVYTIKESEGVTSFTGGTTGKSLKVIFTKEDAQIRMAYLDAFKYKLGVKNPLKVTKGTFSGRSIIKGNPKKIFWRQNYFYKQRIYSTFHITEANLPYYISDLNKHKPEVLNGFVSALTEVAAYIKRNGVNIYSPNMIFTTSETLLDEHRLLLEEVFRCRVYNQYASAEGAPFVTECIKGQLHYNIDTGVIEIDSDGNMVVTSFTTNGTPLIRYNIGDVVKFKDGTCTCGNSHPLIERIDGRKVDFLYKNEKEKISLSHLADVIKGNPNSIIKMQFIQNTYEEIIVKMEVDKKVFTEQHKNLVLEQMRYRFGDEVKIKINIVDLIERESSGKYQIIKNNIK